MIKIITAVLFVIAFLVRIISISEYPAGFTPDEASFGYDAYSILKTGEDQWGQYLPLTLKSFGDYKLPLYTYLSIPFVAIFGLNEFSVRLLGAVLGFLSVLISYKLFSKLIVDSKLEYSEFLKVLFLAMISLSPWHVALSRGAFEANLSSFFMPLGIYLFISAKNNKLLYLLSALSFGLNMFSYHSARVVTPLVIILIAWTFRKKISKNNLATFTILVAPFVLASAVLMLSSGGGRLATSSILSSGLSFGDNRFVAVKNGANSAVATIFHNKPAEVVIKFSENFLSYLSPQFYLSEGAREATYGMLPGQAILDPIAFVGLIFGIIYVFRSRKFSYILIIIAISLVPASLSVGPGHAANRAALVVPFLFYLSSLGLGYLIKTINESRNKLGYSVVVISLTSTTVLFVSFLFNYIYIQPTKTAEAMFSGMDSVVNESLPRGDLIVSRNISESHIFFAFYSSLDPVVFQSFSKNWDLEGEGVSWVDQLSEWSLPGTKFRSIDWVRDLQTGSTLVVKKGDIPEEVYIKNKHKIICWLCE